jgi:hypothetical protein
VAGGGGGGGGDKLRFWRVTLRGLPPASTAAEIAELLAPNLALPAEMIRLPPAAKALSEGEASFTLKIAAEAEAARGLGDGALGSGVSVHVEEVAAGSDDEVFVRYLPFVATPQEVEELFTTKGDVVKVKLMSGATQHRTNIPSVIFWCRVIDCEPFSRAHDD